MPDPSDVNDDAEKLDFDAAKQSLLRYLKSLTDADSTLDASFDVSEAAKALQHVCEAEQHHHAAKGMEHQIAALKDQQAAAKWGPGGSKISRDGIANIGKR